MHSIAFISPALPTSIRHINSFRSSSFRSFSPVCPPATRPIVTLSISSIPDSIQEKSANAPPQDRANNASLSAGVSASQISLATSHPTSFRVQAADVFMLCIFCAGCLYPAIRSQEAAVRTRALLAAGIIFSVNTILYLLRMRSIQRRFIARLSASKNIEAHLNNSGQSIRSAIAAERTYMDDSFAEIRDVIYKVAAQTERKTDRQHAEVLRGMRGDVDELRAGLDIVRHNLSKLNSDEISHLRDILMQRERSIVVLETKLAAIKSDLDASIAREGALRSEIDTLKAAAGDTNGLHERLLAAQTRTATLEERLLRAQDSAISPPDNTNLQLQQIPGSKALREALLNLGKSFPPAGKLLFDPPAENTPEMDRRSMLSSSSQPQSLQQDPLNWPQAPLGRDDMGLPKDGGFGTNHFSDSNENPTENTGKDPFSALRGAFNEDSSGILPAVQEKPAESENSLLEKLEKKNGADEALGSQESNLKLKQNVDMDVGISISSQVELGQENPSVEPASEDEGESERVTLVDEPTVKDEAASSTGSYLESLRKDTAAFEKAQVSELDININMQLSKARELVKRARRGDAGEAERSFSAALELLDSVPKGGARVSAEIGSILLAWARRDIGADGAKSRLQRGAELLRNCVQVEQLDQLDQLDGVRFNLALTLCMLASLEESPGCEALYEEACGHYDKLGTESRTVCFNSGLAYISRARLAEAANRDGIIMYRTAEKLFNAALQFSPQDTKSKTYREECRAKLKEAESE